MIRISALLISTALTTACLATPGLAQVANSAAPEVPPATAETSPTTESGDIIVTARRRAEDISRIPVSVSAFSGETLSRKAIQSTGDLAKITPGLNIVGAGSVVNTFITIRGQSRGRAGPGTPGVLSYFNEVPLPTYGSLIPTFDMDNVQVLKGPQGTLFGRNAIGGAVLTYSKRPTYDFGGYLEASYGRFHETRLEGAVNVPIVPSVLAVRLSAQVYDTDGFTKTFVYTPYTITGRLTAIPGRAIENAPQYDAYKNRSLRASVLFDPAEGISNLTVVDYFRNEGVNNNVYFGQFPESAPIYLRTPAQLTTAGLAGLIGPTFQCGTAINCDIRLAMDAATANGPRVAYTDVLPVGKTSIFGVSNTTTVELGEQATLKNIFGYRTTKSQFSTDTDGSAMAIVDTATLVQLKQISNELQLSGKLLDGKLKYVLGGFYFKSSPNGLGGYNGLNINVFNGLNVVSSANYLSERSKALFGQLDYDLSDLIEGLSVTAGYRYSWDRSSGCAYSGVYNVPAGTPPLAGNLGFLPSEAGCTNNTYPRDPNTSSSLAQNFVQTSRKGTYTFAINWQATPNLLLYATTRRGYRSGGFNVPILNPAVADLQTFAPETLTDVEIGTKGRYDLGGARGTFNIALYRGIDKDYQYFQGTTGVGILPSSGLLVNKADLIIKGFEAELTLTPVEGFTVGGSLAYNDISVQRVTIPASLRAAFVNSGASLAPLDAISVQNQPAWQANTNVEFTFPTKLAGADLRFNGDFHYQSKYPSGDGFIAGYKTVDTRLTLAGLQDGRLDASIFARNLFNEVYAVGSSQSPGTGVVSFMYAAPRTYGVSLRYRFD